MTDVCLVDARGVVALFGVIVAPMAGLARVFASFYMLKMVGGRWQRRNPERLHKVLSLEFANESAMAVAGE